MLLHAIAEAAGDADPARAAFRAGYELLARIQAADPAAGPGCSACRTWADGRTTA